ncbi:hypothetical protein [Amycolatopsis ruanii]|uniref:hypothetical protein n=1 Tax=Amycolatopsis ruanii TaxID=944491 RepID=UPI001F085D85|nr:hypothetical protein [Amycolatopsis ruanii]
MNGELMCEALDGNPEAMREFATRIGTLEPAAVAEPPGPAPCAGGMQACGVAGPADAVATLALARFLLETREAVGALAEAAAAAARDYEAGDHAGARAFVSVFVEE